MVESNTNAFYMPLSMFLLLILATTTISGVDAGTIKMAPESALPFNGGCDAPALCGTLLNPCTIANTMTVAGTTPCEIILLSTPGSLGTWTIQTPTTMTFPASQMFDGASFFLQAPLTIRSASGATHSCDAQLLNNTRSDASSMVVNIVDSIIIAPPASTTESFVFVGTSPFPFSLATVVFSSCQFDFDTTVTPWSLVKGINCATTGSLVDVVVKNSNSLRPLLGTSIVSSSRPRIRLTVNDSTNLILGTSSIIDPLPESTDNEILISGAYTNITSSNFTSLSTSKSDLKTLKLQDRAIMMGFTIEGANIEIGDDSLIANSFVALGSSDFLIVTSGNAQIVLDDSLAGPSAPSGFAVVFYDTFIFIQRGAHLTFSNTSTKPLNSYYQWAGTVTVLTGEQGEECVFDPGSSLFLEPNSKLFVACRTILMDDIKGAVNASIEGFGTNPKLVASGRANYNDNTIDLTNFAMLEVQPWVNNPTPGSVEIHGTALNVIGIAWQTRIIWPPTPLPSTTVDTPLYLAKGDLSLPDQLCYEDPSHTHRFFLSFVPHPVMENTIVYYRSYMPPSTPSTSCPPPPPGFICSSNGQWISTGNVSTGQPFIIPSGVTVKVNGSFSSNSSIIFQGTGQTLVIDGCLTLSNSGVVVDLTTSQWKPGTVTLIKQNENCPTSLDRLAVSVKQPKSGCKKVKSQIASSSNRSTLNVIFTSDNSGCNTKWIILGAVSAAVIVIALIVTIVVVLVIKSRNEAKIRESLANRSK